MSNRRTNQPGATTKAKPLKTIKRNQTDMAGSAAEKASASKTPTSYKNQAVTVQVSSADEREFAAAVARDRKSVV